jgi:hypothetical protein
LQRVACPGVLGGGWQGSCSVPAALHHVAKQRGKQSRVAPPLLAHTSHPQHTTLTFHTLCWGPFLVITHCSDLLLLLLLVVVVVVSGPPSLTWWSACSSWTCSRQESPPRPPAPPESLLVGTPGCPAATQGTATGAATGHNSCNSSSAHATAAAVRGGAQRLVCGTRLCLSGAHSREQVLREAWKGWVHASLLASCCGGAVGGDGAPVARCARAARGCCWAGLLALASMY